MAKKKPRMKIWVLNIGGERDEGLYELAISVDEPHVKKGGGYYCFYQTATLDVCCDVLEQLTSIRLKPGEVGRLNLRNLKALKCVEANHGKEKSHS